MEGKQWLAGSREALRAKEGEGKSLCNKTLLKLPSHDWTLIILFCLSMSGLGLHFYPMALAVIGLLLYAFKHDRYMLLLMIMELATGQGFMTKEVTYISLFDIVLAASLFGLFFYRKNPLVKKCTLLIFGYIIFLLAMSTLSDETFAIQFQTLKGYITILAIIIPLWIFADKDFDIQLFWRKTLGFFLVICAFYVIDGLILQGWVLLPGTYNPDETASVFYNIRWNPLGTWFPRKYPSAAFLILLVPFPLARYYKLKWWQWLIVVGAFAAMRTFSVIIAFLITLGLFQVKFTKFLKYFIVALVGITSLYFIDSATGNNLRIASSINQFLLLNDSSDEEAIAEFGTGRASQVIPKWQALVDQHCQWQGFGFLHPEKTTLRRYQIENDMYVDIAKKEENAAITEVTQFNTILNIGIIGLIVQTIFFIWLWVCIRHSAYAPYYLSTLLIASIMGAAGFTGLNHPTGLLWIATALGVILLTARKRENAQPISSTSPNEKQ